MDEFIEELSACIGIQWKHLARKLNLNTTDIDAVTHDNILDLREQIFQFFAKWKQLEGDGASIQKLVDGLQAADLQAQLQTLTEKNLICRGDDGRFHDKKEFVRSKRLQWLGSPSSAVPDRVAQETAALDSIPVVESDSPRKDSLPSPKTAHFSLGDMVMVEQAQSPWYGVVRWIGTFPGTEKTICGVEMEDVMVGGTSGLCLGDNIQHFTCEEGHALYLPLSLLKRDHRFSDTQRDGPYRRSTQPPQPSPPRQPPANTPAPARQVSSSDTPLKVDPQSPAVSELADLLRNTGFPLPGSEATANPAASPSAQSCVVVFQIPNDTVGIVIGRDGKNISEIEHETNTNIQIPRSLAGSNSKGVIRGSEVNCRRALVLIAEKIEQRQKQHMAHVKVKEISNAGRVIGRGGSTKRAIETLSGARIKIEQKPQQIGLGFLFGHTDTCRISGSHEEIMEAERLIDRALAGEDIHAQATIMSLAAVIDRLMRLGLRFEE